MTLNRSFLFAPGNVARRVEKALTLQADAVILDLEDSVAPSDKPATRKVVAEALARPRECRGYVWLIANLEREHGVAEGSIDLMPLIETAAGVQRVERILQARSLRPYAGPWRVKRIAFGAGDYANDVGLAPTLEESELADARARLVLASRAAGLENPVDSPWFHFKEADAFRRALERSRRGGFQGRLCVHPDQIGPVNGAYLPTEDELAAAERIVAAFRDSEAKGEAAIQVDGQMIDYPIVHRARRLLEAMRRAKAR